MSQSVRFMPVSLFGAAMGLAGFALATRAAAPLLGLPASFAEVWAAVGLAAFAVLVLAYVRKLAAHFDAVRAEWGNPAQAGFFGSIWIAASLAAACLAPYAFAPAKALWWIAVVGMLATQIAMLARWSAGGFELAQVNTGWMIAVIGPLPVAGPGLYFQELEPARFLFGAAAVLSVFVVALVFVRMIIGPPIPAAARPTWFVLLVPFALAYAYAPDLWAIAPGPLLDALFSCSLVLLAALLVASRGAAGWPFGPPWWAFTFPLDAMVFAGAAYARVHGAGVPTMLLWALWLLALAVVLVVLARTLVALARGALLAAPKPA